MKYRISKEMAEAIFKDNCDTVRKIAYFLTKSKELSEDIVQETFIRIFQKYDSFDSSRSIQPWIYKITLNTTRNMLRKQKWLKFIDKFPDMQCMDMVENVLLKDEEEQELWKVINTLSIKEKEVILLHFYYGKKLKEVSEILGIPQGTVKSRLNSALNSLRKRFPENTFDFIGEGGYDCESIQYMFQKKCWIKYTVKTDSPILFKIFGKPIFPGILPFPLEKRQ